MSPSLSVGEEESTEAEKSEGDWAMGSRGDEGVKAGGSRGVARVDGQVTLRAQGRVLLLQLSSRSALEEVRGLGPETAARGVGDRVKEE